MSKTENGKTPSAVVASSAEPPRRCHVIKVPDFDGYGFNLHAEKGKPGQYIGKVDDGSPAQIAGLRQGDRIIEVNAVNIGRETHKEVVQRIKAIANEVQLLVVDASVTVSKENRIVDLPVPDAKSGSDVVGEPVVFLPPPPPPRDTMVPSQTPDVVVQLPSSSSTSSPKLSSIAAAAVDVVDHAAVTVVAVNSTDVADVVKHNGNGNSSTPKQHPQHLHEDTIVPITIKADRPIAPNSTSNTTNATSTFSTSPKDHGHTNGVGGGSSSSSKFISTASFITSEQSETAETSRATTITSTTANTRPAPSTVSAPPSPSATTVSATSASSPPQSPPANHYNKSSSSSSSHSHSTTITTTTNNNTATHQNSHHSADAASASASVVVPLVAPAAPKAAEGPQPVKSSSGLNLNMTVAELRAKLAAKKKFDPKSDAVDLRKKFEIVEKL